ncbi:metal ABC transporter permease [Bacteroidetes/Chlorobi group bacterium ChocPot_Mid]|nr:MAG: metal ABC transporter permease [Bacteroidetes/Chlorobi group bacterium ChocPot_Mid]
MLEVFSYEFMQRAIIAGILVGFVASYYGSFVVQRRMSFMGSGLAHTAFGGIALGLLLESEPLWIAIPFTVIVSILITWIKQKAKISVDTSIGILFSVSVALGIIFISLKEGYSVDAFTYLFGSILSVNPSDLWFSSIVALITILTFFNFWHKWAYASFDVELASADRHKVQKDNYLLSILIAISIVISIKLVGIVLIAAFLVVPPAAAKLLSKTFYQMTILSVLIGVFSALSGLYLSLLMDIPSGATIILVQALIFVIALLFSTLQKER